MGGCLNELIGDFSHGLQINVETAPSHMDYTELFKQKFTRVEREIDAIRDKIHLTKGAWIFKMHLHSQLDLMQSDHFNKVHSICEKIGDDVMQWRTRGELPDVGMTAYQKARDRIARLLRKVRNEIRDRKHTGVEVFLGILDSFTTTVLNLLPTVGALLKVYLGLPSSQRGSLHCGDVKKIA